MPTTIFWPYDVKHSGFCYGWNTPAITVVGVIEVETENEAITTLERLHRSIQWRTLPASCRIDPVILGTCEFSPCTASLHPIPVLQLQSCIDYIITYYHRHQPNTLRFYALDVPEHISTRPGSSLYLPSAQHDFTAPNKAKFTSGIDNVILEQFNTAKLIEQALQNNQPLSVEEPEWLVRLASFPVQLLATLSIILTTLSNLPVAPGTSFPLLKDISATIHQLDVRAEQMHSFATEVGSLRRRTSTHIYIYSARYTKVWLILNDITMGIALGSFICENQDMLSQMLIETTQSFVINWVQWALQWLDSWPAGLKLNTELSRFYSHTFIGLVTIWGSFLQKGVPFLPTAIYVIGVMSSGGITMTISLLMDLLALLTAHIYICYVISGAVYQRMLKTAGSLWNLFRGKRYNVLRNRTDAWEYDIDQLLFGTILFTLLAFLFPTVLVYYTLFALMRLGVLVVQAALETLLAFMNHFPLFALMLRVKDPWRLPGGIYFQLETLPGSLKPLLVVKNQPVPLSIIFIQYIELLSRLAKHYNPLRLLLCLFSGQHLAAIPRYSIRYNKIPVDGSSL